MANSFLDIVKGIFGRVPMKNRSSLILPIGSNLFNFSEINNEKAITKGFNSNTAVYSIVMTDAEKFGTIPRYLYDSSTIDEKAKKSRITHEVKANIFQGSTDLINLLNRPNEYQSQDAFLTALRAFYKVCGETFVWLNRGDGLSVNDSGDIVEMSDEQMAAQPVLEMYVLPANHVILVGDPNNLWGVNDYILNVGGNFLRLGKPNVIHWKSTNLNFDPYTRTHLRGFPPLTAGAATLDQNNISTVATTAMYSNGGARGALTNETFDKLSPEQQNQIKAVIDSKINNVDVKSAIATIQGKWQYLNFGGTAVDMQLLEGKQMSWQELCFLLGVPFEFFDTKTTFANKEQAQNGWVNNKIIPACKQFDGELNRVLLKAFGLEGKAFIGSDFTDLLMAQRDMALLITSLAAAWWITPNEKREQMNEEAIDDPQLDEVWVPQGFTPLSQYNDNQEMNSITQELAQRGLAGSMNGKTNGVATNGNGR